MHNSLPNLHLGRDWLTSSSFSETEKCRILGDDPSQHGVERANYNWIGEFLYEEVGLHEEELPEWFRSSMKSLDDRTPLAIWRRSGGFERVYQAAQEWRDQTREDLGDDFSAERGMTIRPTRSEQQNMMLAVDVFRALLTAHGVEVDAEENNQRRGVIWNSDPKNLFSIWFHGEHAELEGYKIDLREGQLFKRLGVLLVKGSDGTKHIGQATINESLEGKPEYNVQPCDFDPFPKRADAEPFVRRAQDCQAAGQLVRTD